MCSLGKTGVKNSLDSCFLRVPVRVAMFGKRFVKHTLTQQKCERRQAVTSPAWLRNRPRSRGFPTSSSRGRAGSSYRRVAIACRWVEMRATRPSSTSVKNHPIVGDTGVCAEGGVKCCVHGSDRGAWLAIPTTAPVTR